MNKYTYLHFIRFSQPANSSLVFFDDLFNKLVRLFAIFKISERFKRKIAKSDARTSVRIFLIDCGDMGGGGGDSRSNSLEMEWEERTEGNRDRDLVTLELGTNLSE